MGQIKWYKRDPSAALNGMMELNLEERGAYNTVLDLIYSRDGNLPDDDRFIAGWLRVDVRVWKRIKSTLITREKLFIADGLLRNERADVEVLEALSRVGSAREAGLASARSKQNKFADVKRNNNNLAQTTVDTGVSTPVPTNHNHNQKEEEAKASPSGAPEPTKPKRSKRSVGVDHLLPADWSPTLTDRAIEFTSQWPPGMLEREEFTFRNHAEANGRLAKDWDAAFRTWLGKADERFKHNGQHHPQANRSPSAGYRGADRRDGFQRALDRAGGFDQSGQPAGPAGQPDAGDGADDLFLTGPG